MMPSPSRLALGRAVVVLHALALVALTSSALSAQPPAAAVRGRVFNSLSGDPAKGAVLVIVALERTTVADARGEYAFAAVPAGRYELIVSGQGFAARRLELVVEAPVLSLDVPLDPELHYAEVVSVSPDPRNQFDSYQPTTVLAGAGLTQEFKGSLGETLDGQPGVAARALGPAPSRPVIRGLDGDRILILQDGQRVGDLSSQSGDHGVTVNPMAATSIEIVRGPATLLYGANAVGGLVNVITDHLPMAPERGLSGRVTTDGATAGAEGGIAGGLNWGNGRFAVHTSGGSRTSADMHSPDGTVENSQSRSAFATLGAAWTSDRSYLGASYAWDDARYGIPVVEEGELTLNPRRQALSVRAGTRGLPGVVESLRFSAGRTAYTHTEFEGGVTGTRFSNDTTEFGLLAGHRRIQGLRGSLGVSAQTRTFLAEGPEALSPRVGQRAVSAFLYEEASFGRLTLQAGGRVDHTRFAAEGEAARTFTSGSGSVGALVPLSAHSDRLSLAVSVARAVRHPALEELFFFGPHHGNFAFEVGNPSLKPERALGLDVSFRWRNPRFSGEATYFRNSIAGYIFRSPIDGIEFEAREAELEARYPGRVIDHAGHSDGGEALPYVEFRAEDSLLQGVEGHLDIRLSRRLLADATVSVVRGDVRSRGIALPRIPPARATVGLRFEQGGFSAGAELTAAAAQERVSGAETSTDGYVLARLVASHSFVTGGSVSTITARMDNATNTSYRNHLSYVKDLVLEPGRRFRLLYSVKF
jgi:iron complex outermembrane recepter protein